MRDLAQKVLRKIEQLRDAQGKSFSVELKESFTDSFYIKIDDIAYVRISDHKASNKLRYMYEISDIHSKRSRYTYPTSYWELCCEAVVSEF